MSDENRLPRVPPQLFLLPRHPREVCQDVGLQWWAALRLAADGYLSYDPERIEKLDEAQEAELLFVGAIAATNCDRQMLESLLTGLEKPYCYRHREIHYDWMTRKWVVTPEFNTASELVANLRDDGDARALRRLLGEVNDALESLGECEDEAAQEDDANPDNAQDTSGRRRVVTWDAVAPAAEEAFNIWVGQPEIAWARKAWQVLGDAGLTTYISESEHNEVLFRFLVLAALYHDYCKAAWEEESGLHFADWAAAMGGLSIPLERCEDWEDSFDAAVTAHVESHRQEVVTALANGFGSDTGLNESLWRSRNPGDGDEDADTEDSDSPWDVSEVNCHTAWQWIDQGCPRLLDF